MTQRGKMLIVSLDDGTGQCEVTVFNEQFEANKALYKEDELLVVQGQARNDAFTGGIRFTVEAAMDLERARSRYAQAVKVEMNGNADALRLKKVLEAHGAPPEQAAAPAAVQAPVRGASRGGGERDGGRGQRQPVHIPNGLNVSIVYRSEHAEGEVRLGDAWRVKPTDDLIMALRGEFAGSSIEIVY
jgi:DNA polymerase-3 subunit alpha